MNLYIVTGGSKGLGAALVNELLHPDHLIYVISRTPPNVNVQHVTADLSDSGQVGNLMQRIFSKTMDQTFNSITLFNNAGVLGPIGKIQNASNEEITGNLGANLMAPILLSSSFIEMTSAITAEKTVINISSGAASNPYDGWSLYCASKAGLEHFTRCVAKEQETASNPVSLLSINPGVMDTGMQAMIREADSEDFPSLQKFLTLYEENQLPSPREVAKALLQALAENRLSSGKTYKVADWLQ
jgi:NAD(P)-dependent dehydrogenase (short-subunit alcohol dehydrogenase family)